MNPAAPRICFGQQPCGFFPRRFLYAKIVTARRLQRELGGEIVFFYHDSDHDPRETKTILTHRKTGERTTLNFAFVNKIQRKWSPLFHKQISADWHDQNNATTPCLRRSSAGGNFQGSAGHQCRGLLPEYVHADGIAG